MRDNPTWRVGHRRHMVVAAESYVLQRVRAIDPVLQCDRTVDVWVERGSIQTIEEHPISVPDGAEVVDASRWVLGPGLVDLYVHTGEPGYEQRETFESLGRAALAGGFTQVALLPSTDPVVDTLAQLERVQARQQTEQTPLWLPLAAMTVGCRSESMTEFAELVEAGAIAFCDDAPLPALPLLRRVLDYLAPLQKTALLWPRHAELAGLGVMHEGEHSLQLGLPGIPASAETVAVAAVLEMLTPQSAPVHLMRLSQARSLELVDRARQQDLPVSASTSWMHLLLCDRDIETYHYDPALHLYAPLGTDLDREALIDAVKSSTLSAIATDHSPYTFEEKTVPFAVAPPGAIGLELALPLLWQHLVTPGKLSALNLWTALSAHPARVLNLKSPSLQKGPEANCILFDPERTWVVNANTLQSQSSATPWWGQTLTGKVLGCWLNGSWMATDKG
ncbi:MAG: dihydroorotase [Cyanobacteria bacterium P01_F01_bin.33]